MTKKVVVIYSGGMDSFTVLHRARREADEVLALSFNYNQRHAKELECAARVCEKHSVPHKILDLGVLGDIASNSSLTGDIDVPEGHYEEESMKQTVVPNRNMVLLSLAIAYAVNEGATEVWYGAHSGDHAIYPDCRKEFIDAMNEVSMIANWSPIEIVVPFWNHDKGGILRWGLDHGLDYSDTWTCYNGREKACGKCGACQERLEAFRESLVTDPVKYETE